MNGKHVSAYTASRALAREKMLDRFQAACMCTALFGAVWMAVQL